MGWYGGTGLPFDRIDSTAENKSLIAQQRKYLTADEAKMLFAVSNAAKQQTAQNING